MIPKDKIERSTQTICTKGLLLMSSSRASLASDRSRSPFQVHIMQFRPPSWPKGGDHSKINLTKSARTQHADFKQSHDNRRVYTWKVSALCRSRRCFQHAHWFPGRRQQVHNQKNKGIRTRVRSTAAPRRKTIGSAWFLWNLVTHPDLSRT